MKTFVISLLRGLVKGHEKANKGNFEKPFVYGRYATLRARVREKILKCGYWRGAYERERERERESSKLFGTTKLLVQKVAKKFKFPCMLSLP